MRLNGPENIKTLTEMHRAYGSWANVRQAGTVIDGVLVVPRKKIGKDAKTATKPKVARAAG